MPTTRSGTTIGPQVTFSNSVNTRAKATSLAKTTRPVASPLPPAPRLSPSPPPPIQVARARLPESRVNNAASVKACLEELDDAVMSGGIFDERSIMTTSELLRVLSQSCKSK